MRIVFCGTPDYAVPSLKALMQLAPLHQVVAVVSQPDRPKGRSRAPAPPPVVEAARNSGFAKESIFQPRSINRPEIIAALRELAPDVLCVVAYGNILKADALALPRILPLNAHGSLLPKYRGAAPIQAALLSGDADTGVSMMKMELGLDSGPVLFRRSIPILPLDDAGSIHDKLAELSAACFVEAINQLGSGQFTLTPQVDSEATHVSKLDKRSGQIDWTRDAAYLERFVRAMNPWPGAWTTAAAPGVAPPIRLRIVRASVETPASDSKSRQGEITMGEHAYIRVGCGSGALSIREVQPEGKRAMSVAEFVRGAGRKLIPESTWQ